MDHIVTSTSEIDQRLDEVATAYLKAREAGQTPDRQALLDQHPDLAAELREFFADQDRFDRLAGPAASADGLPSGVLGDFRIIREVGRGGMGVVYEAEQISLGRRVALKVLPFAAAMDPRHLQRFQNEARAAACLHHTNIVPVFAVGCERGVSYYAMQFIDGTTLADVIRQLRRPAGPAAASPDAPTTAHVPLEGLAPPGADTEPAARQATLTSSGPGPGRGRDYFRRVAELGMQAADALDHAHQAGVVHRDVKPGNLLLDGRGCVWVADFGLALVRQGEAGLTMTGEVLGTLRYMSPEQALAKRVPIDHRTDIYSLGATLYELLTLRPVFEGKDRQELLRQIAFEEPRPPRRLDRKVPAELEVIVLKALEKNPADRYATAQEMADDLRRFLEDKPIRARRPSWRQVAAKWARRHRTVVRSLCLGLLAVSLTLAISTVLTAVAYQGEADQRRLAGTARDNEAVQRKIAEDERDLARNALYPAYIHLARQRLAEADTEEVRRLLDFVGPRPGGPDPRGWEWHYLDSLCHRELFAVPQSNSGRACCCWSPDGGRLAVTEYGPEVSIRDGSTGGVMARLQHPHDMPGPDIVVLESNGAVTRKPAERRTEVNVVEAAWSPDGRWVASGGTDAVRVWDARTATEWLTLEALPTLYGPRGAWLAWSPDGRCLAAALGSTIKVWDVGLKQERRTFELSPGWRTDDVFWCPDGAAVTSVARTSVSTPALLQVWDLGAGVERFRVDEPLASSAWARDGLLLATVGGDRANAGVHIRDGKTGNVIARLPASQTADVCLAWGAGGELYTGDRKGVIRAWDAVGRRCIRAWQGHSLDVLSVTPSPDGRLLASTGQDRTVKIWNASDEEPTLTLRGPAWPVTAAVWSPDSRQMATISLGDLRIWDLACPQEAMPLPAAPGYVGQLAWSPDGRRLAVQGGAYSAEAATELTVWDAETGRLACDGRGRLEGGAEPDRFSGRMAWSPEGGRLAVIDQRKKAVTVWDLASGKALLRRSGEADVAWHPDGKWLATVVGVDPNSGRGGHVEVWSAADGQRLLTLDDAPPGAAPAAIYSWRLAWSPDARPFLAVSTGERVTVWDVEQGRVRATLPVNEGKETGGGSGEVARDYRLAWSPDGRRLATLLGGEVTVWDAATGARIRTFGRTRGLSRWSGGDLAWSPDGRRVATALPGEEKVKVWDPDTGMELFALTGLFTRVAWSPDGKRLAGGAASGMVYIWEAKPRQQDWAPSVAEWHNNLAWRLATAPSSDHRDPTRALELARQAVAEAPPLWVGTYNNTLGVAEYRNGHWKEAASALARSVELTEGGSNDFFFLAMSHWQLGEKDEAHRWYAKAVAWMDENRPQDEELLRFRAEAAALLGEQDREAPSPPK